MRGNGVAKDPGRCLPVDAYYPSLHLVLEYREKQHTESVTFWDGKPTKSGVPRGIQREIYDARRREVLPAHGIDLLEISYSELSHGANRRLRRESAEDLKVIRQKLARWIPAGPAG